MKWKFWKREPKQELEGEEEEQLLPEPDIEVFDLGEPPTPHFLRPIPGNPNRYCAICGQSDTAQRHAYGKDFRHVHCCAETGCETCIEAMKNYA